MSAGAWLCFIVNRVLTSFWILGGRFLTKMLLFSHCDLTSHVYISFSICINQNSTSDGLNSMTSVLLYSMALAPSWPFSSSKSTCLGGSGMLRSTSPSPTINPSLTTSSKSESSYSIADPLSLHPANSLVTSANLLPTGLFLITRFSSSMSSGSRVWLNDESTSWKSSSDSELSLYEVVCFLHSRYGRLSASFVYSSAPSTEN